MMIKIDKVYFELTNLCNLDCRTCYNRSGQNTNRKEISLTQLTEAIELLAQNGLERVLLSGGEPTLHSEFDDILDLVDKFPQFSFGIVTNGTNHHPKLIHYLNTRKNLTLQVSLDGSNEERNSKTRGVGNFDKTISFAKQITTPHVKPLLKMVLSQNNFEDLESFYMLALEVGFVPEFAFIYKSGNGGDGWEDKSLTSQQKMKALRFIDQLNHTHNSTAFLPLCTSTCPFSGNLKVLSPCVKVDGAIQPCQMLYDSQYTLGNLFSFDEKAFEERLKWLSEIATTRRHTDFNCVKCLLREACGKGCMAMAVNLWGDPLKDDGECDFRKMEMIGYRMKGKLHG